MTIEIDDVNLKKLHNKELLLEELKIQQRIKIQGDDKYELKFMNFITHFLAR